MSEILLKADNITMQFGGLKAVDSLSFEVKKNSLVGLIGPNGAGKTTVFNMLTGVYTPTKGDVIFNGQKVTGLKPYEIARRGMTRTFQNIRLFKDLSVLDNILISSVQHNQYTSLDALFKTEKFLSVESELKSKAKKLLNIFKLAHKIDDEAGSLPYGEQRKLEILRALATQPQLICLDEPAAGMNHQETHSLMETIAQVRKDFGLTVLLIEHDMKLVMGICENIVVIDHGVKIDEGVPSHIQNSSKVIEAYLGVEEVH